MVRSKETKKNSCSLICLHLKHPHSIQTHCDPLGICVASSTPYCNSPIGRLLSPFVCFVSNSFPPFPSLFAEHTTFKPILIWWSSRRISLRSNVTLRSCFLLYYRCMRDMWVVVVGMGIWWLRFHCRRRFGLALHLCYLL